MSHLSSRTSTFPEPGDSGPTPIVASRARCSNFPTLAKKRNSMPCRRSTAADTDRSRHEPDIEIRASRRAGRTGRCLNLGAVEEAGCRKAALISISTRKCPLDRRPAWPELDEFVDPVPDRDYNVMHACTDERDEVGQGGRLATPGRQTREAERASAESQGIWASIPRCCRTCRDFDRRKWRAWLVQQPVGVQASAHGRCGRSAVRDQHWPLVVTW